MSKHTPGPWTAKIDGGFEIFCKTKRDDMVICGKGPHDKYAEEIFANARLIAAAPTMLFALEAVIDWWKECENDGQVVPGHIQAAYAAIKLAKGY